MRYVKWTLWGLVALLLLSFFHYTLPQRDIVRVIGTEVRRVDFGENSIFWAAPDTGTDAARANRDVRFIETIYPNGKPMVFRNEDTGWGWPPYLKLDSSNLQAEARDLVSTQQAPVWVAVRHYGWRNQFFSIFPNAVSVKVVEAPDVRLIPWLNIVILGTLVVLALLFRRMWMQFRQRTIDPLVDDAGEAWDRVESGAQNKRAGLGRWLDTWKKKDRR